MRKITVPGFVMSMALLAVASVSAQTNFATLTTDGAWTWYNDPRALFYNVKLYFGYVRAGDSKTALSSFDLTTGQTSNLWNSGFTQLDDHNNPGLLAKQDGRLLAVYARHISDQYFSYRTSGSTNPFAPSGWNAEINIPNSGAGMTYANPFQLSAESGKIYNFCRNQNFNPTIFTSTDGGTNWSAPQLFIQAGSGGTVRPYLKYSSDYTQRVDFLYTDGHPRDIANSLYHLYYQGGAFYKTDGALVKNYASLPILHDSGERGSVIYQYNAADQADPNEWIPTGRAWCWETAYQSNGAPVCVFTVQRDNIAPNGSLTDRIYYYYARWTGSAWQKRFIAHAGRPLYNAEDDYAGGICVDPVEPNVIYISSNAQDPFNLSDTTNVTLRASERYELWRGVTGEGGLSFSWSQITSNSVVDNLRPYIPRRNGGERCVLWFRGNYATYTSYSCSIVGLFTTAVPTPPAAPKITYVEATTGVSGNTTFAAGGTLTPTAATSGTDGLWRLRTLGNSATAFESGGDIAAAGNAVNGNNENAARLATTITGLNPNARYHLYAYFWSAPSAQDWRIRASLTNSAGDLPLFSNTSEPTAVAGDFVSAPLIVEADRLLQQASLGEGLSDNTGKIVVYVDDDPAARAGIANGWNLRSWYDGVGYAALTPASIVATNLNYNLSGNTLQLSWPSSHLGWRLETQTNSNATGISPVWFPVSGATATNQLFLPIDVQNGSVFYRLVYP
ncbi:MAG: BNR-4 repeat-containing protein [Verrucomicrobiota bacterium]